MQYGKTLQKSSTVKKEVYVKFWYLMLLKYPSRQGSDAAVSVWKKREERNDGVFSSFQIGKFNHQLQPIFKNLFKVRQQGKQLPMSKNAFGPRLFV